MYINEVERDWSPLSPLILPALLRSYRGDWWLAGGWSLDMWLGHPTRIHEDTDIVVFREDIVSLLESLPDWIIHLADPPGTLRPWTKGEPVPTHVHDIWCRHNGSDQWQLQFMVIDGSETTWRFRRDPRIGGPRATMGWRSGNLPILAPEIQLLYKAKPGSQRRSKDDMDLRQFIPRLSQDRRQWLQDAVNLLYPEEQDVVQSLYSRILDQGEPSIPAGLARLRVRR
jgi:hypothetical protein